MVGDRVQLLASAGIHELPTQFVRPAHEQPANSKAIKGVQVPKISLSQPPQLLEEQLGSACREWGFFVLTDHGISAELIQRLQDVGKEFFGLPQEEKEKYANDPSSGSMEGYGTRMTKNLDQKVEWIDYYFHLTAPASRVNHDLWPRNPPAYRVEIRKDPIFLIGLSRSFFGCVRPKTGKSASADKEILTSASCCKRKIEMLLMDAGK
ncbi:hypothetical protein ACLOJK_013775 [Asimina triloba]